jgi:hypothetical protein
MLKSLVRDRYALVQAEQVYVAEVCSKRTIGIDAEGLCGRPGGRSALS